MVMIRKSLYDYCIEQNLQALLTQWDTEHNGTLSVHNVASKSHKAVWWRCDRGHRWQARIGSRVQGRGCPYCSNKKIVIGENDLGTTHPKLAAQWNYMRNTSITPQMVVAGNHTKVWWQCEKGHEWQASILSRSQGSGCPVCAGKVVIAGENDLASIYPHIAAQWHPTLNDTLTPEDVTPYSNRSVWWICEKGHEWHAQIKSRAMGRGCPYCAGQKVLPGFNDLATKEPILCKQWCQELNGSLTPQMITASSSKKAWWKCQCGYVWKAVISSRTGPRRHGCPACAGKIRIKQRC